MKRIIESWNGVPLVFEEMHRNSIKEFLFKVIKLID